MCPLNIRSTSKHKASAESEIWGSCSRMQSVKYSLTTSSQSYFCPDPVRVMSRLRDLAYLRQGHNDLRRLRPAMTAWQCRGEADCKRVRLGPDLCLPLSPFLSLALSTDLSPKPNCVCIVSSATLYLAITGPVQFISTFLQCAHCLLKSSICLRRAIWNNPTERKEYPEEGKRREQWDGLVHSQTGSLASLILEQPPLQC